MLLRLERSECLLLKGKGNQKKGKKEEGENDLFPIPYLMWKVKLAWRHLNNKYFEGK